MNKVGLNRKINYSLAGLVREKKPLIHCITNYVTAQDVANIILACGASPIMADHPEETAEVSALCSCLLLNTGTLKENSKDAMIRAGREANRLNHPIILDPVGCGASRQRIQTILAVMKEIKMTVIRGNVSEIKFLLNALIRVGYDTKCPSGQQFPISAERDVVNRSRGVDADFSDQITDASLIPLIENVRALSVMTGAVIVMTGTTDIVSTGEETWLIRNGCTEMSRITGSGCMLDGIIAAYIAAASDSSGSTARQHILLETVALATAAAGLCGERAAKKAERNQAGSGSFRCYFTDEVSLLNEMVLKGGVKIEIL